MRNDRIPFRQLRSTLLDLGFVETVLPGPYRVFEHAPSETLLFYHDYRPGDAITWGEQVKTRIFPDEKGILETDGF